MPGRHCTICVDPNKLRRAAELIAEGVGDAAAADVLRVGRMAMHRHRIAHVLKPARAIVSAAVKSRAVEAQRAQVIAAAEAGDLDPADYLAVGSIVDGLRRTAERLERTAGAAEMDGQRIAVSALSAQQTRLNEVRAKLGGHGGYGATKGPGDVGGDRTGRFSVEIVFSTGKVETISTRETIEGQAFAPDEITPDE